MTDTLREKLEKIAVTRCQCGCIESAKYTYVADLRKMHAAAATALRAALEKREVVLLAPDGHKHESVPVVSIEALLADVEGKS